MITSGAKPNKNTEREPFLCLKHPPQLPLLSRLQRWTDLAWEPSWSWEEGSRWSQGLGAAWALVNVMAQDVLLGCHMLSGAHVGAP